MAGGNGVGNGNLAKPVAGNGAQPAPPEGAVTDAQSDIDNCVLETADITSDEDLPQAEGGISK